MGEGRSEADGDQSSSMTASVLASTAIAPTECTFDDAAPFAPVDTILAMSTLSPAPTERMVKRRKLTFRAERDPVPPRGVHLDDERLALGALRALGTVPVRVHDRREPHVLVEVREAGAVRGGERRARGLGLAHVRCRAAEVREAVDGCGEERGRGRVEEGRRVVGVVVEERGGRVL
jgi:hypothetical protein